MSVDPAVVGLEFTIDGFAWTVLDKCDENSGRWVCTTHGKVFATQLEKDFHIGSGSHVLAWACAIHGPEVP